EFCWLRLLRDQEGAHFASISEGARGFATRSRLAELYAEQNRSADAEAQWKHALRERPGYLPALRGLGELYLRQERFADLDWLITSSEGSGQGDQAWLETIVLRARRHLATKELDKARQALEHAIDRAPREPFLWRLLSHALLQQGKDGDYAE